MKRIQPNGAQYKVRGQHLMLGDRDGLWLVERWRAERAWHERMQREQDRTKPKHI